MLIQGRSRKPLCCLVLLASFATQACDALSEDESDRLSCDEAADCALASNSCCLNCNPLTPADVTAVNLRSVDAHNREVCRNQGSGCTLGSCIPRAPTLFAACEAGRCVTVELAQHPATACTTNADCRVRAAVCCECNAGTGPGNLVAISDEDAFASLVCSSAIGCDGCLPAYPREAIAVCEAGSCVVHDPRLF